jgi:4-hydroxy 2-oxovalerate aldolase
MQLSFITAQDVLDYQTERRLIIDSSLYGMGRGAGNLHTELIANYYNKAIREKYDIIKILDLISTHIMPIKETKSWGYSLYFFDWPVSLPSQFCGVLVRRGGSKRIRVQDIYRNNTRRDAH